MMELFEAIIRGLDRAYMKHAEETRKKASKRRDGPPRTMGGDRASKSEP